MQNGELESGAIVTLTRRGRRALKTGLPDDLSPDSKLLIEILARVRRAHCDNVVDLSDELLERYGSHENVIAAIRSGEVQFTIIEEP
jgi:hypothetical protein